MKNKKAIELIDKILEDLDRTGINTETLIDSIKALRAYALEEQVPLVVKTLRLTYEHIEANDSFLIPMPKEEVEEGEEEQEQPISEAEEATPLESLKYLLSLLKNLNNKINIADLKEYRDLLTA